MFIDRGIIVNVMQALDDSIVSTAGGGGGGKGRLAFERNVLNVDAVELRDRIFSEVRSWGFDRGTFVASVVEAFVTTGTLYASGVLDSDTFAYREGKVRGWVYEADELLSPSVNVLEGTCPECLSTVYLEEGNLTVDCIGCNRSTSFGDQ